MVLSNKRDCILGGVVGDNRLSSHEDVWALIQVGSSVNHSLVHSKKVQIWLSFVFDARCTRDNFTISATTFMFNRPKTHSEINSRFSPPYDLDNI